MDQDQTFTLSRRSFVGASAAVAAAGISKLWGIPALQARADEAGPTFTYGIAGDPGSAMNPFTTEDRYGMMVLQAVYSTLAYVADDGTVTYNLAEGVETSDDGTVLTAHLREGVTWSDGEPFTSADVVFTFEEKESDPIANGYYNLTYGDGSQVKVEAVDDLTVTFTFPVADPTALSKISNEMWIAPEHMYKDVEDWENNDVNTHPVGTGPYILDEYAPGQYVRFRANEGYFLGKPEIPTVVFQIITNDATGQTAVQTGEVDAWIATPAGLQQMSLEPNGLKVTPYSEGRVAFMAFNCVRMPDANVRKAVMYSFNKEEIALAALLDPEYFQLDYTFLPPNNAFYTTEGVEKYDQNVEKAKQLLAEAGQENPTFTLAFSSGDAMQQACAVMMQEQAAAAGITLDIVGVDLPTLSAAMRDPENRYDMYFGGYIMGADPSGYDTVLRSDAEMGYSHQSHDDYPEIDDLFDEGAVEMDPAKRREIYDRLQAVIADAAIQYPLYSNLRLLVTSDRVGGLEEAQLVPIYTFEDMGKLTMA